MPIDQGRILSAQADPLQIARQQAQAQQQLHQALQLTIEQPHTIERLQATLCVLAKDGPNHVLLAATPSGKRYDIVLSPQALASLARAAVEPEAEEKAA